MGQDYFHKKSWLLMDTPVYMVDVQQGNTEWLSRPLTTAGLPLDIIHTPNREFFIQDTLWRLQLTIKLLRERRKRLEQEYAFSNHIDEHRQIEARLNYLSDHDELTGLANRTAFEKALDPPIPTGTEPRRILSRLSTDP